MWVPYGVHVHVTICHNTETRAYRMWIPYGVHLTTLLETHAYMQSLLVTTCALNGDQACIAHQLGLCSQGRGGKRDLLKGLGVSALRPSSQELETFHGKHCYISNTLPSDGASCPELRILMHAPG